MAKKFTLIQPFGEMIVTRLMADVMEESEGGLALPPGRAKGPPRAIVLAVGPGKKLDSGKRLKMDVKVGDVVLIAPPGAIVKIKGKEYGLFPESNVLAILDEEQVKSNIVELVK